MPACSFACRPANPLVRLLPVCVAAFAMSVSLPQPAVADDDPGQAELDTAIDTKLSAGSLEDFQRVLDLCKRAVKKGLSEDSEKFAEDLYTSTLIDRASMIVEAIFDAPTPSPQWPQMRAFALRDLREALDRDPKLGTAQLMVARLESLPQGNRARAKRAVDAAIELVTDDKLQLAEAHVIRGNLETDSEKKIADFNRAVDLAPRDKDVRRTRGLFYLLNDDYEKARRDIEAAIEEAPEDATLREALGMAYMMEEKFDDAQQAFDKAIELAPESSGALLQRARVLALRGERPRALADLDKAIELEPDAALPLVLRARIHQQAGDTEQAEADLDAVLEREPDNPAALELRGLIAADRGDYASSIRDFRRLVAANPDDPVVISQLGMLYLAAKQPRESIRRFTRALELDPKLFVSLRGRSDAEISIGDHAAAIADLEKAHKIEPDDTGVLNNLAWLLATSPDAELRDGKRAIELAEKACEETQWKAAHIISTLAAGYAETGNFEKAREYSRKAVEVSGDVPEMKEQLAEELESYEQEKPWRERQEMEEAAPEVGLGVEAIEEVLEAADEAEPAEPAKPAGEQAQPFKPRRPFE